MMPNPNPLPHPNLNPNLNLNLNPNLNPNPSPGAPLLPPPLLPPASARSEARAPPASRSASLGVVGLEALPASVATADGELQGAPMSGPSPFTPLLHYPHPLALALSRTSTLPAHSRLAITPRPQLQPTPPRPPPHLTKAPP